MIGLGYIIVFIATIPLGIVAIVNGAKAIKAFKAAKKAANVKPIATLILGIVGIAYGASSMIVSFCSMVLDICVNLLNTLG